MVNADKLGHEAYAPGTACFDKVVGHFGSDIVAEDGSVNRRALGQIVFGDPGKMRELEAIVWPEIEKAVLAKVEELRACGSVSVVVIEAAIMLKAGWCACLRAERDFVCRPGSHRSLEQGQAR